MPAGIGVPHDEQVTDAEPPARTRAFRTDGDDAREFALLTHTLNGCTTLPDVYEAGVLAARHLLSTGVAAVARIEQDEWHVLAAEPTDALPRATDAL